MKTLFVPIMGYKWVWELWVKEFDFYLKPTTSRVYLESRECIRVGWITKDWSLKVEDPRVPKGLNFAN